MKSKIVIGLIIVCILLISALSNIASAGTDKVYTFRLGCMTAVDYPFNKAARWFKTEIEKETDGQIIVEVYDGGVLGSESEMWEGTLAGTIDMFVTSPGNISTFVPEYQVMDGPYIIDGFDHFSRVIISGALDKLNKMVEDKGLVILGQMGGGRRVMLTKDKYETLEDIKGIKMRVWPADIVVSTWEALGTVPTLVAYAERYQGLQAGLVDAMEGELSNFVASKLYEVTNNVILTDHAFGVRPFLIGKKQLNSLPEDLKEVMIRLGKQAGEVGVQIQWEDDEAALNIMKDKFGIGIIELKDREKWAEATEVVRQEFMEKYNLQELFKAIEEAK